MSQVITIHSFMRGAGTSNIAANIAVLLAQQGKQVGIVDTDFLAPSLHLLFGLAEDEIHGSLTQCLLGQCSIEETAHDVTPHLNGNLSGRAVLIPASPHSTLIGRDQSLRPRFDVDVLHDVLQQMTERLGLDVLVLDACAGLTETTLVTMAISDAIAVILLLDKRDYQGTGVTIEVARRLEVPNLVLVVNQMASSFHPGQVKQQVEQTYRIPVAAILPYSEEMQALASADLFVLRFPQDPITAALQGLAARLIT